ncbi:hypothetical protein [Halopiger aswanensis]|uniref:hypothetical protein n=1 Tax=Halopiger aswanensis TaxID=148449 RepID=UPI0011C3C7E8|nr:hypothetical protein [Halopiger aswanensis]
MSIVSIGSIASTAIPLQSSTTVGITAAIIFALAVFVGVMVYLAFGPHNTILQDDETPISHNRSAAGDPGSGHESDAEGVQGQPDEPTASAGAGESGAGGESDSPSST